jgi:ribosome-interacting GTPase 1
LGVEVATTAGLTLNESEIRTLLNEARIRFAQLLADEISETISDCSRDSVLEEIRILGLNRAFENLDRTS